MKEIKVLGTGCSKCQDLYNHTQRAITKAEVEANITKVEDIVEIMEYNVMSTPALVIDGEVVVKGKIPSVDDIVAYLTK